MDILNHCLDLISSVLTQFVSVEMLAILFWAFLLISVVSGVLRMVYR